MLRVQHSRYMATLYRGEEHIEVMVYSRANIGSPEGSLMGSLGQLIHRDRLPPDSIEEAAARILELVRQLD